MECKHFKEWLPVREPSDTASDKEARKHARTCSTCARLLAVDDELEKTLRNDFCRTEAPVRLHTSVAMIAEEPPRLKRRPRWPWLAIPSAALPALALLLLVFWPLGQGLTSIESVARLAEKNHMAGYTMEFQAGEVMDVSAWFDGRLAFEVVRPDLSGRGFEFLGGRKCSLGKEDIAYLFYAKDGKRYSLFELDAKNVQVELLEDRIYRYPVRDCIVEIWKEANRVFVLVA